MAYCKSNIWQILYEYWLNYLSFYLIRINANFLYQIIFNILYIWKILCVTLHIFIFTKIFLVNSRIYLSAMWWLRKHNFYLHNCYKPLKFDGDRVLHELINYFLNFSLISILKMDFKNKFFLFIYSKLIKLFVYIKYYIYLYCII